MPAGSIAKSQALSSYTSSSSALGGSSLGKQGRQSTINPIKSTRS